MAACSTERTCGGGLKSPRFAINPQFVLRFNRDAADSASAKASHRRVLVILSQEARRNDQAWVGPTPKHYKQGESGQATSTSDAIPTDGASMAGPTVPLRPSVRGRGGSRGRGASRDRGASRGRGASRYRGASRDRGASRGRGHGRGGGKRSHGTKVDGRRPLKGGGGFSPSKDASRHVWAGPTKRARRSRRAGARSVVADAELQLADGSSGLAPGPSVVEDGNSTAPEPSSASRRPPDRVLTSSPAVALDKRRCCWNHLVPGAKTSTEHPLPWRPVGVYAFGYRR